MGNYCNYNKRKSKVGLIIKILILLVIAFFIYACYYIDFFKNNQYVMIAKEKISGVVTKITTSTKDSFSILVESYEPDEKDNVVYEITDSQNRYYYNQLDEGSKIIYAEILGNVEKIKHGEDNIRISSKLSSYVSMDDMSDDLMKSFQNAWDAFRNDNVDLFYIDGTKMCLVTKTIKKGTKTSYEFYISKGNNESYLIDGFSSAEEVDKAVAYVNTSEQEILESITEQNDYYKIMKAHNWIVENVQYNMADSYNNANLYGALKDKKVVCEGYARLFKSLMDKMDIPCVLVSGVGIDADTGKRENHAWNFVYLKGNWYAIDVTWDDPVIIGNGYVSKDLQYKYFLKGSQEFSKTHIADGQFVDNGMEFKYPELSTEDYVKEN